MTKLSDILFPPNLKFLHPVGISTFKYGVTIPVEMQTERMRAIDKGGKASVTILFGTEEPVVAEIRRLNNKPGHLQFRYENKAQVRLREYLLTIFGSQSGGSLLEVEEVAPFTFIFKPILKDTSPCLRISDMLLHRLDKREAKQFAEIEQIEETLAAVKYDAGFNQSDYNGRINDGLVGRGGTVSNGLSVSLASSVISRRTVSGSRWSSAMPVPIIRTM